MYKNRKIIGIVPARGGSKGLPGKNIKVLCGKPLIAWSIESGLNSRCIDEIMVTTEDEKIAEIARKVGASIPFIRPAHLALDTTPTLDVVIHALDYYKYDKGTDFDYCVLIEPTSPLREKNDLAEMTERLIDQENLFDSMVSIGEVHEHPSIMKKIINHSIEPYCGELATSGRRQDNPPAYFPYGVAYVVKTAVLREEKTFYTKRNTFYKIKRYQSYEIDDIYDFLAVENIMRHEWGLK